MARRDGKLVKGLDTLHIFTPLLYPNRCDNEAFVSEQIDLTNIKKYLETKNNILFEEGKKTGDEDVFKYTIFHLVVTAILKVIHLRPKMNWFIANKRIYERNEVTAAFIIKKKFSDSGAEGLAFIKSTKEDNIDTIYENIKKQVYSYRGEDVLDSSSQSMENIGKLPFFIIRFAVWLCRKLDVHGHVPKSFVASDPFYASVVLSNLGSIKLKSGYHHLTNWGTNSLFCVIGEKKYRPYFKEDGSYDMRDSLELGLTVDERLADGYYYSKSIRLLKKLLENPELLEKPLGDDLDY